MSIQKKVILSVLVFGLLIFMYSCAGSAGRAKVKQQVSPKDQKATVTGFAENWQDYDIYAAGQNKTQPWAIVFHPKNNNRNLDGTRDRWYRVEDKKKLDSLISWLESGSFVPRLLSILGPDDQLFAYIYTYRSQISTKMMDANTIFVFDITQ